MRRLVFACLSLAFACTLFGSAMAQDPNDATTYEVQGGAYAIGTTVTIDSVVVTGVAPFALWVQELTDTLGAPVTVSPPLSGVFVFTGSTPTVNVGDLVTVRGDYAEFFGVTEINIRDSVDPLKGVTDLGTTATVPLPADKRCQDLNNALSAEPWEGVLVRLDSVRVVNTTIGFGEYILREADSDSTALTDTCYADDTSKDAPPMPALNTLIKSVTGALHFSFGNYKVNPRDINDLDFPLPPPNVSYAFAMDPTHVFVQFDLPMDSATVADPFNYFFNNMSDFPASVTFDPSTDNDAAVLVTPASMVGNNPIPEILDVSGVRNADGKLIATAQSATFIQGISTPSFVQTSNDSLGFSQVNGIWCTVTGIVTRDNTGDYNQRYYIEEAGGDTLSGLFVFDRVFPVTRGDSLVVAGPILEFGGGKTEVDDPVFVTNFGPAATGIPGPDTVTIAMVNDPSGIAPSEKWEGVLVAIKNVTIVQPFNAFGEWRVIDAGGDTLIIDNDGAYTYPFNMLAGQSLACVVGPMDFGFGTRRLQPGATGDLIGINVTDAGDEVPGVVATELLHNRPNPFNPTTEIRYRLLQSTRVRLKVYDARGALVRTLVDRDQQGGQSYTVVWDGRDDSGRRVASGVYFYSLHVDDKVLSKKMVLLK